MLREASRRRAGLLSHELCHCAGAQTLREMLEKLLDDDSDMHAMHLTARAMDQLERQVSAWPLFF